MSQTSAVCLPGAYLLLKRGGSRVGPSTSLSHWTGFTTSADLTGEAGLILGAAGKPVQDLGLALNCCNRGAALQSPAEEGSKQHAVRAPTQHRRVTRGTGQRGGQPCCLLRDSARQRTAVCRQMDSGTRRASTAKTEGRYGKEM